MNLNSIDELGYLREKAMESRQKAIASIYALAGIEEPTPVIEVEKSISRNKIVEQSKLSKWGHRASGIISKEPVMALLGALACGLAFGAARKSSRQPSVTTKRKEEVAKKSTIFHDISAEIAQHIRAKLVPSISRLALMGVEVAALSLLKTGADKRKVRPQSSFAVDEEDAEVN